MMIGAKLTAARKALGLTQEQLAEKLDVTAQAVSSWERNDNLPDLKKLILLARVLKISPNELLAEEDSDWKLKINDQQPLLDRAIEFATVKHSRVPRKGTSIPYITHVIEAMEIVSRMTDDEEIRAAAVLHDTLEDTETTQEELIRNFGPRVADLVAAESENKREGQPEESTWHARKQETIRHLSEAATEIRMIALGDKLSNIRALHRDYQAVGEELWKRFNQKNPIWQGWYYGSLANIFSEDETIRETQAYREYVELCSDLFSRAYDGDGNLVADDEDSGEDELFTGIPLAAFRQNLEEWLENPHWREYYESAPSDHCRLLIALEFWYSETGSNAAVEAMRIAEEGLSLDDWQHLYKYCGNNPRKAVIHDRIMDIQLKDQFDLLTDIRSNPDRYDPLVDHAGWHHERKTQSGDVNIGWNIGLLAENRPWFAECWARDGMTMLTYFISTRGIEESTPVQLQHMLEDAGIVRFTDPDRDNTPAVSRFKDGNGNEFFSVNILVGVEDEDAYITKDSGIIYRFRELNRFNEACLKDPSEE